MTIIEDNPNPVVESSGNGLLIGILAFIAISVVALYYTTPVSNWFQSEDVAYLTPQVEAVNAE